MYTKIIIEEFEAIIFDCKASKENIDDFLYFYSATFGVVRRVMNLQCEPTLVLAHLVLENSYQSMNQRWAQTTNRGTAYKIFPQILLTQIIDELSRLTEAIKENDDVKIRLSLEKIANISYIATGNGNYLFHRGKLKLKESSSG